MELYCEMCNKKIATLIEVDKLQPLIKIDMAVCKKCDDALWEKAIKARSARK